MAAHPALTCALLLALAPAVWCDQHVHSRRLLIRPLPGSKQLQCRNTLLGPWLYTDDKGTLCKGSDLDRKSGCCTSGEKHSCSTCDARDQCCEGYEACVSCCLAPANGAKERLPEVPRVPGKKGSGTWSDEFELCSAVCRTHSRSTSHENSYIAPRHHCFSKLGKPMLSPPLPANALKGVTVAMGAPGMSCDAACARVGGQRCAQDRLALLNTCDRLREAVACEAGCIEEPLKPVMPYYADGEAPKADRPALCVAAPGGGAAAVRAAEEEGAGGAGGGRSCSASQPHMRRLCPCVAAPAGGEDTAAAPPPQGGSPVVLAADAPGEAAAVAPSSPQAEAEASADGEAAEEEQQPKEEEEGVEQEEEEQAEEAAQEQSEEVQETGQEQDAGAER